MSVNHVFAVGFCLLAAIRLICFQRYVRLDLEWLLEKFGAVEEVDIEMVKAFNLVVAAAYALAGAICVA